MHKMRYRRVAECTFPDSVRIFIKLKKETIFTKLKIESIFTKLKKESIFTSTKNGKAQAKPALGRISPRCPAINFDQKCT